MLWILFPCCIISSETELEPNMNKTSNNFFTYIFLLIYLIEVNIKLNKVFKVNYFNAKQLLQSIRQINTYLQLPKALLFYYLF